MAVYVDNMRAPFRRMIMCHMVADTDDELHTMARRIDVARRWHQRPGTVYSHYDICLSKRALAVQFGAVEIDNRELASLIHRKRGSTVKVPAELEECGAVPHMVAVAAMADVEHLRDALAGVTAKETTAIVSNTTVKIPLRPDAPGMGDSDGFTFVSLARSSVIPEQPTRAAATNAGSTGERSNANG